MTDIQGLRAQLKDTRPAVRSSSSGGGGIPFWAIAAGAAALGFAIVLFTPHFYTTQRTAALPGVQAPPRAESAEPAQAAATTAPEPAGNAARYAGKAPEEVVRTVEIVCDERAARRAISPPAAPGARQQTRSCTVSSPRHRHASARPI